MSAMLGKRKRDTVRVSKKQIESQNEQPSSESESEALDAQEIFRRHFEAQFAPLPVVAKKGKVGKVEAEEESEEGSEGELEGELEGESDWDGISDEEDNGVQVVEHTDAQSRMAAMSKEELKSFMSSKIPKSTPAIPIIRDKEGATIEDNDPSEAANLKKDLALQRLLTESHLLESSTNPTLNGNNRHKATDLRLQSLGAKKSLLKQEKMPMSHRKGIIAKAANKDETRRREARENGVILEKAKMGAKKGGDAKRERGVGNPMVGKFSSGTLTLSKKDIFDIEGPKRSTSGRGGRGGRGGGRGRGRGRGKRGH